LAIVALGKFGGQEMNYHSDLDIIFVYEADGHTVHLNAARGESTSNQHFFSELAQRIIKTTSRLSPLGRLYEIDARLRPTGRSGALATALSELSRYFLEGSGQLWERQAMCKARMVYGSPRLASAVMSAIAKAVFEHRWLRGSADEIRQMRHRLEETAGQGNLKRGVGGLVDVEFLVQMLQLKHGRRTATLRVPNTLAALSALCTAGHISTEDAQTLDQGYRLLRTIEGRLRLMNSNARDTLPEDPTELAKLARLLNYPDAAALLAECERVTQEIRGCFERIFAAEER
jgi:[glutamine synthetase] adenylyltransferase / [glutamine synthetase]-adenylyl-L-tyrosine phosphorylase